jgi:hypothetical protein
MSSVCSWSCRQPRSPRKTRKRSQIASIWRSRVPRSGQSYRLNLGDGGERLVCKAGQRGPRRVEIPPGHAAMFESGSAWPDPQLIAGETDEHVDGSVRSPDAKRNSGRRDAALDESVVERWSPRPVRRLIEQYANQVLSKRPRLRRTHGIDRVSLDGRGYSRRQQGNRRAPSELPVTRGPGLDREGFHAIGGEQDGQLRAAQPPLKFRRSGGPGARPTIGPEQDRPGQQRPSREHDRRGR